MDHVSRFIGEAILDMANHGITVRMPHETKVTYNELKCNGFFDSDEFVCAVDKPVKQWLQIFLHEYCHFLQYKENKKKWLSTGARLLFDKQLYSDEIIEHCKKIQSEEIDCEKRAVALIKAYKLGFDLEKYIQAANAYIYFFETIPITRQWYKKPPYEVRRILEVVPYQFKADYSKMPEGYLKLVKKYCL